jgi:glycine cleavage system H protein
MSEVPADLKYLKSHEWARREADGRVTVGISDHAQDALGDLVYVELPQVGQRLAAGEKFAVVESVKAASDVYSPVAGVVVEVNAALADAPETINRAPYGEGWIAVIEPAADWDGADLLDAAAYGASIS